MTPEQRKALQESLAHWDYNVELAEKGKNPEIGPDVCACCRLWIEYSCIGCPIFIVTGQELCNRTFYRDVCNSMRWGEDPTDSCKLERDWLKLILESEVDDDG